MEKEQSEHQQMDEIGNLLTFLDGLSRSKAKTFSLELERGYSKVLRKAKNSVPMRLPKKRHLLGLQKLTLKMDYNHKAVAILVSCLLNSSPNLEDLEIIDPYDDMGHPQPLAAEFWEKQIDAECFQNHLSTVTFDMSDSFFNGCPCLGLAQFLAMNARVLKRMSLKYRRWVDVQHEESDDLWLQAERRENEAMVEAAQRELRSWPRASPDVRLELCSC